MSDQSGTSQVHLAALEARVPAIAELSDSDWLAAMAYASMRRTLNDGARGPQRDMGHDINQRGDEAGLIGEIVGLRLAERAYPAPAYHVQHSLLAWRWPLDAPDVTITDAATQGRLQLEVKTLALQMNRRKFLMNQRGHERSKAKGVTHYLFVIAVSGGQRALVSTVVSVATVDRTFTLQDELFGRGQNRAIGVDLDPFLDSMFGDKPTELVPSWRQLGANQRKAALMGALSGEQPVAPARLERAARYGAIDLVVRLRGRADPQTMAVGEALDYAIHSLNAAHQHANVTALTGAPLPLANAAHETAAREAARQCRWPAQDPQALRRLLHELATDMRLHDSPVRQAAFDALRGDAFFGDASPWLDPTGLEDTYNEHQQVEP